MPNCPQCNSPYEEGQKFCNTCGAQLFTPVKQNICPVCGNTILENTKVCSICGTPVSVPQNTTAAEELARQQEALKNPTMDEVEIPVITDDMLGLNEQQPTGDMPTMDSIFMPGQQPAPQQPKPVQIAKPQSAPAPQPPIGQVNQPQQNIYQQPNQFVQNPQPVQPQNNYVQPQNFQQNQYQQAPAQNSFAQSNAPQNQYQQPQTVIPQGNNTYQQPNNPPQNNAFPNNNNNNAKSQQNGVQPGKSANGIVPIILIIAIIAVIIVDVFVVFKKQIFKDKDDKAKKNTAIVTMTDYTE